jgi:hypothetical protein
MLKHDFKRYQSKTRYSFERLAAIVGVKYSDDGAVLPNPYPESYSLVAQMDKLRKDCEEKVGEAQMRAAAAEAQLSLVRQDMHLLLDHFGIQIVTLTGKEVRKIPTPRKGASKK